MRLKRCGLPAAVAMLAIGAAAVSLEAQRPSFRPERQQTHDADPDEPRIGHRDERHRNGILDQRPPEADAPAAGDVEDQMAEYARGGGREKCADRRNRQP